MKTWQAVLINIGLMFGSAYLVPKIKDPDLQKAIVGAVLVAGGAAAKVNSETDANGNTLPKP